MKPEGRIHRYLEERAKHGLQVERVERLVGDASARSYYRVHLLEGSAILALLPAAFDPDSLPFLNVARLFEAIPVPIPRIRHVSGPEGILLLEDLGDDLLQRHVKKVDEDERRRLYREAIAILGRIQQRGAELRSEGFLPYRVAFDERKLYEELVFFKRHFLEGLRGARLSAAESVDLDRAFLHLAGELASRPRVLCHRDYHSRNIMLRGEDLVVIDFQDARLGPVSYDLVSLLRDSYVEHQPDFVGEMRDVFCRSAKVVPAVLAEEFDLTSLQRNLKALGTFGFQIAVKRNEVYRPYVPHTLELVRSNLERNPRWEGLRRTMAPYLPEIA